MKMFVFVITLFSFPFRHREKPLIVFTVWQITEGLHFRCLSPLEQEASFTSRPKQIGPLARQSSLGEFTSRCWAEDQMWCQSPRLPNTVRRILHQGKPFWRAARSLPGGNITQLSPTWRLSAKEPAVQRGSLRAWRRSPVVLARERRLQFTKLPAEVWNCRARQGHSMFVQECKSSEMAILKLVLKVKT